MSHFRHGQCGEVRLFFVDLSNEEVKTKYKKKTEKTTSIHLAAGWNGLKGGVGGIGEDMLFLSPEPTDRRRGPQRQVR